MKRALSFTLLAAGLLLAAPLAASAQGTIDGLVVDANSGLTLAGARVQVAALSRSAVSDRSGRFRLLSMPAGPHAVSVRYLGYEPQTVTVAVTDGATSKVTVRLAVARTNLQPILVSGARSGQAAALSQQKAAVNVTNVVSSDQIGRFPDSNIGDAMKRIPGIAVQLDQGEARFGLIRGTEARLNSVTINGERVPSAEAEVREVQLDLVPADMVQQVEVNKTLTPDMDADAIGASVNIVTRAAPAVPRLSMTLGSGYNTLRQKPMAVGNVIAGARFLDDRLGVIVSGSYFDHILGSDNVEAEWDEGTNGAFVTDLQIRRYDIRRIRRSASASLDWRIDDVNTLTFRTLNNARDDWENRYRVRYIMDEPGPGGALTGLEIRRQTKGGIDSDRIQNARLEDQRAWSHQLAGDHLLARKVPLTWSVNYAQASESRPDERYIEWRARNLAGASLDQDDPRQPVVAEPSGLTAGDFSLRNIQELQGFTFDRDLNGRVDLTLPFREGSRARSLKVGLRYRGKTKERDNRFDEFEPVAGSPFEAQLDNLGAFANASYDRDWLFGSYRPGVFTSNRGLGVLPLTNATLFERSDVLEEYAAGNFAATEQIGAAYAMWTQRLTDAVSVIGGVRYEQTEVDYDGFEFDIDNNVARPTTGASTFRNLLPSAQVRWDYDDRTVLRAAWTNTLARPNYFDLVPYRSVNLGDDELAFGNPDLKPTTSMNFDVMAERYFETVGLVSAGVFHKEIRDFIFTYAQNNVFDPVSNRTWLNVFSPRNGSSARLTGVEVAFQRQLTELPGLLRWIGVYGNYTFNNSSVSGLNIPDREGESLPLLGTAKHVGNGSLSFDHPRIQARLSVQYQSAFIDPGEGGYSESAFFDRWYDAATDVDFNATIVITPKARFFLEANNLTNRPLRFYQGVADRLMQNEFYGPRLTTGLRLDY